MFMWLTYWPPWVKGNTQGVPFGTFAALEESVHHRGVVDTVAAPAQSNTQTAANSLSRKGRTTCGNRPRGEVIGMVANEANATTSGARSTRGSVRPPLRARARHVAPFAFLWETRMARITRSTFHRIRKGRNDELWCVVIEMH
jgi:hypothetical protein